MEIVWKISRAVLSSGGKRVVIRVECLTKEFKQPIGFSTHLDATENKPEKLRALSSDKVLALLTKERSTLVKSVKNRISKKIKRKAKS